ncbi:arabinose efflux permease family protein [Halovivax ruber XH-70]|uniref:Arabinose efflux permease family protein n=1 Tax=Halovivax ruber (strain DSM 18193 / JCM 13892 / XH-70) TaxID=797302 RepID=L0IC11_HALRX|nr:MFS transporter [Halovivax ruber]AGB17115.1 arabinose efflux permease family protein [Halovivax ruber XH-70]
MRWPYKRTVLALTTLAFFATMAARMVISPVVPQIRADFGVSNTVVGVALTGLWMSYFLSQFPSGVLADRYGERPVILLSLGGTALASLALALSPVFGVFVVATLALGALAGLHYSVGTTLLTRTYDDVGKAIGVHTAGGPIAGLAVPGVAAWVGVRYGWEPAIAIGAVVAGIVFVLFARFVQPTEPQRPAQPMRERFEGGPLLELLRRPPIAFAIGVSILSAFVWQATASFLPTFLHEFRGYPEPVAGGVFAAYFLVQGVASPLVGTASDRYGRDETTAISLAIAALGFVALVAVPGWLATGFAVVTLGVGLSWSAAFLPRFFDVFTPEEEGAGFGFVRTVYGMLGALGSVGTGLLADAFGWGVAFGVLTALLVTVCAALLGNRAVGGRY